MSLAAKAVVAYVKSENGKGLACLCGYLFILGGLSALVGILSRKGIFSVNIAEEFVKSPCGLVCVGIGKGRCYLVSSVTGFAAAEMIRQSMSIYPQLGVMEIVCVPASR